MSKEGMTLWHYKLPPWHVNIETNDECTKLTKHKLYVGQSLEENPCTHHYTLTETKISLCTVPVTDFFSGR